MSFERKRYEKVMRKYDAVWMQLKQAGKVEITVSKSAARRVLNGIKSAKTAENVARRRVGLVGWSKLVIEEESISATQLKITLSFLYQTKL